MTGLIRPEFELAWDLLPVLVTFKFDKDLNNNELASMATLFSEKSFQCSMAHNTDVNDPNRLEF